MCTLEVDIRLSRLVGMSGRVEVGGGGDLGDLSELATESVLRLRTTSGTCAGSSTVFSSSCVCFEGTSTLAFRLGGLCSDDLRTEYGQE